MSPQRRANPAPSQSRSTVQRQIAAQPSAARREPPTAATENNESARAPPAQATAPAPVSRPSRAALPISPLPATATWHAWLPPWRDTWHRADSELTWSEGHLCATSYRVSPQGGNNAGYDQQGGYYGQQGGYNEGYGYGQEGYGYGQEGYGYDQQWQGYDENGNYYGQGYDENGNYYGQGYDANYNGVDQSYDQYY